MTSDEQIGKNLTAIRGDMSQKDLAAEMRRRGHKWSQSTVWSVEKGERPLRLTEASTLENIFDVSVYQLTNSGEWLDVTQSIGRIGHLREAIEDQIEQYLDEQRKLTLFAAIAEQDDDDDIHRFLTATPVGIAKETMLRYALDRKAHKEFIGRTAEDEDGSRFENQLELDHLTSVWSEAFAEAADGEHPEAA